MEISNALLNRRTIRKFNQKKLDIKDLETIVNYARLAAYPANLQPLKYAIITDEQLVKKTFPYTKWAGYLPKTGTPKEGEQPTAYIAILGDKSIKSSFEVEAGAAVTSMMLGAYDLGIGSCWLGSIERSKLLELFNISPDAFDLVYLLALGYPAQESSAIDSTGDIKYYEESDGTIKVPKRPFDEVIIKV